MDESSKLSAGNDESDIHESFDELNGLSMSIKLNILSFLTHRQGARLASFIDAGVASLHLATAGDVSKMNAGRSLTALAPVHLATVGEVESRERRKAAHASFIVRQGRRRL
jgi:hypothetical protein